MIEQNAATTSKRRKGGATPASRRISFASLDLEALERDLNALNALPTDGSGDGGRAVAAATAPADDTAAKAAKLAAPRSPRKGAKAPTAKAAAAEAPPAAEVVAAAAAAVPGTEPPAAQPVPAAEESPGAAPPADDLEDPLASQITRQGRLLMRLSAATEGLEARFREFTEQQRTGEARLEEAREELRQARQQARRMALENVRLMDALDWVYDALSHRDDPLAAQVASARRDCLRHLAAVGITEIPADGRMDGRLHEGLETVRADDGVPQYHVVSVVRRGYQMGPDVLRRTEVTTAE